jgi:hypothetical protein
MNEKTYKKNCNEKNFKLSKFNQQQIKTVKKSQKLQIKTKKTNCPIKKNKRTIYENRKFNIC